MVDLIIEKFCVVGMLNIRDGRSEAADGRTIGRRLIVGRTDGLMYLTFSTLFRIDRKIGSWDGRMDGRLFFWRLIGSKCTVGRKLMSLLYLSA
jgi:hypothetical protein